MRVGYKDRPYPNRLRVTRRNAGLQQRHIAARLGLNNANTLVSWESERSMPSGTNLIKLCILYGKTPLELYPEYSRKVAQLLRAPETNSDGNA